jgi:hypothetical protein
MVSRSILSCMPAPEAKREQRGMWGDSFKEPWNYLQAVRWKAERLATHGRTCGSQPA